MAKKLVELWEIRCFNQQFPLIGSRTPGDGNGYHDKISSPIPYWRIREDGKSKYDHWFYHIYCRNLSNYLNPKYRSYEAEILKSFKIINCSENYKKTLYKYLNINEYSSHENILDVFEKWGRDLVFKGRVIIEFTSWFDNKSNIFYAFELDSIDPNYAKVKRGSIHYSAPFENINGEVEIKKVLIPRNKCIIIDWPSEIGGYRNYIKTVNKVLKLGSNLPSIEETLSQNPETILQNRRNWDIQYNCLLSKWGNSPVLEDLNAFYKQINNYRFKKTTTLLMNALIEGFRQLLKFLNHQLGENAELQFYNPNYDISIITNSEKQWIDGKISFTESNKILDFS